MNTKQKIIAGIAALALTAGGLYVYVASAAGTFNPDALNQPAGYVGQPAVTSTVVSDGRQRMFIIDYAAQDWSGNLHSYDISATGAISATDNWSGGAQAKIDGQNWDSGRYIVTFSDSATPAGITFRWDSLSGVQKGLLDPGAPVAAGSVSPILNYIRGDDTNQMTDPDTLKATGNNYRYRAHKLGDIIHSTPVYCPASDCGSETVFVGANDGMLHAINAEPGASAEGTERFAYVPSMLLGKLKNLTNVAYTHNYYVDGRMAVWKIGAQTILAGTLGAGGKGLFGLNVTNANATSESDAAAKVLWEITNTGAFAELGHIYGQPILEKVQTAAATNQAALVVGNGYNNTVTGTAVLYLINPETGALIKKIDTGSGNVGSPNGLSTPTLWSSGSYGTAIDTAYAGDIDGNLWKFDLVAGTASRLFTVDTSPVQAITTAPGVMRLGSGVMVTFATGRLYTASDKTDNAYHYAYGIWDGAPVANTALLTQTLTEESYTDSTSEIRVRRATSNDFNTSLHKGWKTRLPIGGERLVGDGAYVTADGTFQFVTVNPTVNTTTKPYGESWWMQLNALTGGNIGRPVMDLNMDGMLSDADKVTVTAADGSTSLASPVGRHMGGGGRSQLIGLTTTGLAVYQGNYDKNDWPDQTVVTTTTTVSRGVSGGHFDFDIFCNNTTSYMDCGALVDTDFVPIRRDDGRYEYYSGAEVSSEKLPPSSTGNAISPLDKLGAATSAIAMKYTHVHEYDDIYDRTGVDMINPSLTLDRLWRAVGQNVTRSVDTTSVAPVTTTTPAGNLTKYPTGRTVTTRNDAGWTTNLPTIAGVETEDDGYPQTSFETLANGNVVETVVDRLTTISTTPTREYTDGTYYECGTRWRSKKCYYTFVDGTKSSITTTKTTKVTYSFSGTLTGFKVLVSNQAYSPAVELTIGGDGTKAVKVYEYQTGNNLNLDINNFPTYTMQTLRYLKFNLPLDGFASKDWGTGITRAGMHPTVPDCVYGEDARYGPSGERRNGALTIQIVKDTVTADKIRMNVESQPKLGYVLKESEQANYLIAEYSTYWHAPKHSPTDDGKYRPSDTYKAHANGGWCMGEKDSAGNVRWSMSPPQDPTSDATAKTPALGSSDPRVGSYGAESNSVGDCSITASASCTVTSTETDINISYDPTTQVTTTTTIVRRTYSDSSSSTTTTTTRVGSGTGVDTTGYNRQSQPLGRINWRELQQ